MISAAGCALLDQLQALKGQVYLEKESTSLTARQCQRN